MRRSKCVQRPDVRDHAQHQTTSDEPYAEPQIFQGCSDRAVAVDLVDVFISSGMIPAVGETRAGRTDGDHYTRERQRCSQYVEHDEEQPDVHASKVTSTSDIHGRGVGVEGYRAPTADLRGVNTFFSGSQMIGPRGSGSLLVVRK
jgi:hypothetical protein